MDKIFIVICEEEIDGSVEISVFPHKTLEGVKKRINEQIDDLIEWNRKQKRYSQEEFECALEKKKDDYFYINASYEAYYFKLSVVEKEISE